MKFECFTRDYVYNDSELVKKYEFIEKEYFEYSNINLDYKIYFNSPKYSCRLLREIVEYILENGKIENPYMEVPPIGLEYNIKKEYIKLIASGRFRRECFTLDYIESLGYNNMRLFYKDFQEKIGYKGKNVKKEWSSLGKKSLNKFIFY